MKYRIIVLLSFLLIASCDCVFETSGKIINSQTGLPIEGVKVSKGSLESTKQYQEFFSGITGQYNYNEISNSCKTRTLYFSHPEFIVQKHALNNGAKDTIFLKPIESEKASQLSR